jgi:predicted small metal-binding protein
MPPRKSKQQSMSTLKESIFTPEMADYVKHNEDGSLRLTENDCICCNVGECQWESESSVLDETAATIDAFVEHLKTVHNLTLSQPLRDATKKTSQVKEAPSISQVKEAPAMSAEEKNDETPRRAVDAAGSSCSVVRLLVVLLTAVGVGMAGVTMSTEAEMTKVEARHAWHGCSCISSDSHPIFLPLLSARARHGTARFSLIQLDTPHSSTDVLGWAERQLSLSHCAHVVTTADRIDTIEQWRAFIDHTIAGASGRTCHIIVAGFSTLSAQVINSWKEIAEMNALRGETVLPDGHQGLFVLVADGGRDWLLEQVAHRTVHMMTTVKLPTVA